MKKLVDRPRPSYAGSGGVRVGEAVGCLETHSSFRKNVLLVEDEAVQAAARLLSLQDLGYSAVWATSGEKAIIHLRGDAKIDVVLMCLLPSWIPGKHQVAFPGFTKDAFEYLEQ